MDRSSKGVHILLVTLVKERNEPATKRDVTLVVIDIVSLEIDDNNKVIWDSGWEEKSPLL